MAELALSLRFRRWFDCGGVCSWSESTANALAHTCKYRKHRHAIEGRVSFSVLEHVFGFFFVRSGMIVLAGRTTD